MVAAASTAPSSPGALPLPLAVQRTSWSADPWTLGSYSFLPVDATPRLRRDLAAPVADRLFITGEATDRDDPSTVHGALASGRRAAADVLAVAAPGERIGVVGAGVAGLAAARDLADAGFAPVVLEARDRIGGRVDTLHSPDWPIPVELGASWVHAPVASGLLDRMRTLHADPVPFDWDPLLLVDDVGGVVPQPWRHLAPGTRAVRQAVRWADARSRDRSLAAAITESGAARGVDPAVMTHALEVEVASEYGASAAELSAWWGQEEGHSGPDHLVLGGYDRLPANLAEGLEVRLAWPVGQVAWSPDGVDLVASTPTSGAAPAPERFDRVIVSVPLGVLKAGRPAFAPALPAGHRSAIAGLGMGLLDKLWLRFPEPLFSGGEIVLSRLAAPGAPFIEWYDLWPLTGEPVLLALNGGDTARAVAAMDDATVLASALASLAIIRAAG